MKKLRLGLILLLAMTVGFMGVGCGGSSDDDNDTDGDQDTAVDGDEEEAPPADADEEEAPPTDGDDATEQDQAEQEPDVEPDGVSEEEEDAPAEAEEEGDHEPDYGACNARSYGQPANYPCNLPDECESGLCMGSGDGWSTFCSARCDSQDCPEGMDCVENNTEGKICVPQNSTLPGDGSQDLFRVCNVPEDCKGGEFCLSIRGRKFCSTDCTAPNGTSANQQVCGSCGDCQDARDVSGIETFICVPEGSNTQGEECGYDFDCKQLLCYNARYCVQQCLGGSFCSPGYECADMDGIPICVQEADLNKPFGEECFGNWECTSGICEDVLGTRRCLEPCSETNTCGSGGVCVSMGSYSNDTKLFLWDAAGETALASNDDFGGLYFSAITYEFTADGTYFAQVTGYNEATEGPYLLNLFEDGSPVPTTLTGNESEENGGRDTANPVAVPSRTSANLTAADSDYFSFTTTAGKTLHLETSAAPKMICLPADVVDQVPYGGDCQMAYQCQGDLTCYQGKCTQPCETDTDCPNGICFAFTSDQSYCVAASLLDTAAYGESCTFNYECEGELLCATYCTKACTTVADCPDGICFAFTQGSQCVPESQIGTVESGDGCTYDFQCEGEYCYKDYTFQAIYCSQTCDETHVCPEGLACYGGFCVRTAEGAIFPYGNCRVNEDCEAGAVCRNNKCEKTCDSNEGCEGYQAIEPVEYGLCAACSTDEDCNEGGTGANVCLSANGNSFCGQDCEDDPTICPEGTRCYAISYWLWYIYQCAPVTLSCEGGAVCGESGYCMVPNGDFGVPCTEDSECVEGLCANGICNIQCSTDDECGCAYYACSEGGVCELTPDGETLETEPNDTTSTAMTLTGFPKTVLASYAPNGKADVDLFKIHVEEGQVLTVWTASVCSYSPDTYLRVLSAEGEVIAENDDIDAYYGNYFSIAYEVRMTATQDLFIEITQSPYVTGLQKGDYLLNLRLVTPASNAVCSGAEPLTAGLHENLDISNGVNDYVGTGCLSYSPSGPDLVYTVQVPPKHVLHVTMDADFDSALYLLDVCTTDDVSCLVGADAGLEGVSESLIWVNNDETIPRNLFLVADSFFSLVATSQIFSLDVEIDPVVIPENDLGENATEMEGFGEVIGTTVGATNDYDPGASGCTGGAETGLDVVFHMTLSPDQLFTGNLTISYAANLYLVTDYSDLTTCLKWSGTKTISHLNETGADLSLYLILDSRNPVLVGDYSLSYSIIDFVCEGEAQVSGLPYEGAGTISGNEQNYGTACTEFATSGPDTTYGIALTAGQVIRVAAYPETGTDADLSLYISKNCLECVSGADHFYANSFESMEFTAEEAGDYVIVVDSDGQPYTQGTFTLVVEDNPVDLCAGVVPGVNCCNEGSVSICDAGLLHAIDCPDENPVCGWDSTYGRYLCGTSASADPSSTYPRDCPARD